MRLATTVAPPSVGLEPPMRRVSVPIAGLRTNGDCPAKHLLVQCGGPLTRSKVARGRLGKPEDTDAALKALADLASSLQPRRGSSGARTLSSGETTSPMPRLSSISAPTSQGGVDCEAATRSTSASGG